MAKGQDIVDKLEDYGWEYIQECIAHTRPHVAGNGKVEHVPDRHIPTIDYFLRVWIPMREKFELINRRTWYRWLDEESDKCRTIKNIDNTFIAIGKDIVANEQKGIFYAKNKFKMSDRQQIETKNVEKFDFEQ